MNKIKSSLKFIGACLMVAIIAILLQPIVVKAADSLRATFATVSIKPAKSDSGTASLTVADKTGTNKFEVSQTNAVLKITVGGTTYTGSTTNVNMTNAVVHTLVVVNGLVVGVQ